MTLHVHHLKGCSPAPLANYLKALGVLRLIAEQGADQDVRGWWQDEHFCLLSKLSREELDSFFLERYEPTPLLSPWNKGCGFFKANDPGLVPLENSRAPRFERFRRGIAESRALLDAVAHADAVVRAIKDRTKTNTTFQSEQQRELLAGSDVFRDLLDQLRKDAHGSERDEIERKKLLDEIVTVESLVTNATKAPTRAQANRLKASSGYKRVLAAADRRFKSLKATLIPDCRRGWRGPHAEWLAAAFALGEDGVPDWAWLVGTGGNDGNLDFTNNFMQHLGKLFDLASDDGHPIAGAAQLLANALWSESTNSLSSGAVGQYQPGGAGGANSTTGPAGDSMVNSWDYILMMEGALLFVSRATRRLDPSEFSRASAPFAVRSHAAGFASPGSEKAQRGEQWMPMWSRPTALGDIVALYGEARVQLKRQTANRPIDVARAISRLGVARGIDAFVRYGYLERNGQSTLAVPLGQVRVRRQPRSHLIDDIAPWMDRLQRRARDKHAPARLVQVERRLADAVFAALTHDYSPERWQAILRAAVGVESLQTAGTAIEARPIPKLQPEWVAAVDDHTPELRLALSLGSAAAKYSRDGRPSDPVRHHWLPLKANARQFNTHDKRLAKDSRVVMTGRDALGDFAAIVQRRLIEAGMNGQRRLPLVAAPACGASLADVAQFLSGAIDASKLFDLARAFMAVDWRRWRPAHSPYACISDDRPEEAWLALRLTTLPWPLTHEMDIPAESGIVRRLLAGDSVGAVGTALARLRSASIRGPIQAGITDAPTARRWAAALVFPIAVGSAQRAAAILDPSLRGTVHA